MAAVVLEVGLSDAGLHDAPQRDRRRGCWHREVHRRQAAGPNVLLQDHRAPAPQLPQVLHMSGTPHFSTHTTTTNRPPRRSGLRGAQRRRATPTRCPRSTSWPRRMTKGNKVPPLVSTLGDTTLTCFRPWHTLSTSDLPSNYPILPTHAHRDHGLTADCRCRNSRTLT